MRIYTVCYAVLLGLLCGGISSGESTPGDSVELVLPRLTAEAETLRNGDPADGNRELHQRRIRDLTREFLRIFHDAEAAGRVSPQLMELEKTVRGLALTLPPERSKSHIQRLPDSPGNDSCEKAYPVGSGTFSGHITFAGSDGSSSCGTGESDIWFLYTAESNQAIAVTVEGLNFGPILSIHNPNTNGCPGDPSDEIACSNDGYEGARIVTALYQGQTYLIRIAGDLEYDPNGEFTLDIHPVGFISGTVTDESTGLPLGGVGITIWSESGGYRYASTNDAGQYVSEALDEGTHYIAVTGVDGYAGELYDNLPCVGWSCSVYNGDPVLVTAGQITSGIDFALARTGGISGKLTASSTAQPIYGEVSAYDLDGNNRGYDYADSEGNYTIEGLAPGSYFVLARANSSGLVDEVYPDIHCDYNCQVTSGTPVAVAPGSITPGIDFALDQGGSITGSVFDESNSALPDSAVYLFRSNGSYAGSTSSDEQGMYAFTELEPGNYYLVAYSLNYFGEVYDNVPCSGDCIPASGTPVSVAIETTTDGIDFSLTLSGSISGTITDSQSDPIPSVRVRTYNSAGAYMSSQYTDSAGQYTVSSLQTGNYYVLTDTSDDYINELYDNIPCPSFCTATTGTPVSVTVGSTTSGIDFQLIHAGSISGTVTASDTGVGVYGITVYAYDSAQNYAGSDYTDSQGVYTLTGLAAGTYYVKTSNYLGYRNELYDNLPCDGSCDVTTGTPVSVSLDTTTAGIDFGLDRAGRIRGKVLSSGAAVPLYAYLQLYDASFQYIQSDQPGSQGDYEFVGLEDGDYYLVAISTDGYVSEVYNNIPCSACDVSTGDPISINNSATIEGIDFYLDKSGSITGTVTDDFSQLPVPGMFVGIYDAAGNDLSYDWTDDQGNYRFDMSLSSGDYFLLTGDEDGYLPQLYNGFSCAGSCDVTTGTPVPVVTGAETSGIDFQIYRTLLTIEDVQIVEGNSGSTMASFEIILSRPSDSYIQVLYSDDDGTALANYDFQPTWGYLEIPAGETSATIQVPVTGDTLGEGNEIFYVKLLEVRNATISDGIAEGTIIDDDALSCFYCDDFEDGVLDPGWNYAKPAWTESNGALTGSPAGRKALAIASPAFSGCSDCVVEASLSSSGGDFGRVWMLAWYADKNNAIELLMNEPADRWIIKERLNGQIVSQNKASIPIDPGASYRVRIERSGPQFRVYVDGNLTVVLNAVGNHSGTVGFAVKGTVAAVGEVIVN